MRKQHARIATRYWRNGDQMKLRMQRTFVSHESAIIEMRLGNQIETLYLDKRNDWKENLYYARTARRHMWERYVKSLIPAYVLSKS